MLRTLSSSSAIWATLRKPGRPESWPVAARCVRAHIERFAYRQTGLVLCRRIAKRKILSASSLSRSTTVCEANQREKLERVCGYVARGPIALDRLSVDGDGLVVYALKHAFRDGTTHVLFEPLDFISRLAALVPRPRAHLLRYHSEFAPNAKHRSQIIATVSPTSPLADDSLETEQAKPRFAMTWMQRLRRVFAIDISTCARCGGQVRVIAAITQPALINHIVEHRRTSARAPPSASRN